VGRERELGTTRLRAVDTIGPPSADRARQSTTLYFRQFSLAPASSRISRTVLKRFLRWRSDMQFGLMATTNVIIFRRVSKSPPGSRIPFMMPGARVRRSSLSAHASFATHADYSNSVITFLLIARFASSVALPCRRFITCPSPMIMQRLTLLASWRVGASLTLDPLIGCSTRSK
jgi:hypothetical protein